MSSVLMQGVGFSHFLLKRQLAGDSNENNRVIDATAGNGHDTVFLAELVGDGGFVWAFDIQKEAIEHTADKIEQHSLTGRVELIHDGHEKMADYISEPVTAIVFNLGYLPGSDKKIITTPSRTLAALKAALNLLVPGGLIVMVIYTGHTGGQKEKEVLLEYCCELDEKQYNVLNYNFINQPRAPARVLAVESRPQK